MDTIRVVSPLYTYGISTRGGRLVEASLPRYRSMTPAERGSVAQILPSDSRLLGLTLVLGGDSIPLDDWPFTASAESVQAGGAPPLRLSGSRGGVRIDLTYTFHPDDYRIDVEGRVTGVGPNGGLLLLAMGPTLRNTEADSPACRGRVRRTSIGWLAVHASSRLRTRDDKAAHHVPAGHESGICRGGW